MMSLLPLLALLHMVGFAQALKLSEGTRRSPRNASVSTIAQDLAFRKGRVAAIIEESWPLERQQKLARMVSKMMWNPLQSSAVPLAREREEDPALFFVQAGDFPYLWMRDSSASLHHYLTSGLTEKYPYVRTVLQGLARTLANRVTRNPKCAVWKPPVHEVDQKELRSVQESGSQADECWDHKTELDQPMYVLRYFRHLRSHGLLSDEEPVFQDALRVLLDHLEKRMHPAVGLVRSDSRPSDDAVPKGYFHVPDNFFVLAELQHLQEPPIAEPLRVRAGRLAANISDALATHATTEVQSVGGTIYCYEVAVLPKKKCKKMDDANLPSLLSLPYHAPGMYDKEIYKRTRRWVLSPQNPYFVSDRSGTRGLGSPHTPGQNVWPLGLLAEGLSASDPNDVVKVLEILLRTDAGTDLMHESFIVDKPSEFTRAWFDWPNSLFVELVDGCCSELVAKLAPQAYQMPALSFQNWTTCGFQAGECELGEKTRQRLFGTKSSSGRACVRYGSTFGGFATKVVDATSFPIPCKMKDLGEPPSPSGLSGYFPPPFHCAVAPEHLCPPRESLARTGTSTSATAPQAAQVVPSATPKPHQGKLAAVWKKWR